MIRSLWRPLSTHGGVTLGALSELYEQLRALRVPPDWSPDATSHQMRTGPGKAMTRVAQHALQPGVPCAGLASADFLCMTIVSWEVSSSLVKGLGEADCSPRHRAQSPGHDKMAAIG